MDLTITAAAPTRTVGNTLNFAIPASTTVAWNASLVNSIVGPWATIGSGTSLFSKWGEKVNVSSPSPYVIATTSNFP